MITKTITINVDVNDGELDSLNSELLSTAKNIDKVEGSAKKADAGLKKVGDNGGAIATLDALTGGMASRIRDAAEASKLLSFNLKGVQAAIVATGIGAFVVALGLVVAYWADIKGAVTGVNAELNDQIELQKEVTHEAELQLKSFEAGENVLRLQGKSEKEIIELKKQRISQVLETTKAELEYQKQQLQGQIEAEKNAKGIFAALTEAGNQFFSFLASGMDSLLGKLGIDIGLEEKVGEVRGKVFDALFGSADAIATRKKEIEDLTLSIIQQQDKLAAIELERREAAGADRPDAEKVEVLPLTGLAGMDNLNTVLGAELDAVALAETARTRIEKDGVEARKRLAEEEADAKVTAYQIVADAFAVASQLAGEQTAAGKAFAVASATISTYLAAVQAFQSGSSVGGPAGLVLGPLAAATAIAAGLANVKKIVSVKVPGSAGAAGGVSGTSPSTPPAFNVVQNNPQNQLNQSLLAKNNEPIETFVVEKKVTSAQEMSRNKIESSSL